MTIKSLLDYEGQNGATNGLISQQFDDVLSKDPVSWS
jgi:hypothetical protein